MKEATLESWIAFGVVLTLLLAIDLFVHRSGRAVTRRAAVVWSAIWVGAGLSFSMFVWLRLGADAAEEYLAAYLVEKALSLDNLFVFLLIFGGLSIPKERQHKVLSWGILGALVFRALFIFLGVTVIERYHWVVYVFGAILLFAAYHALREDPAKSQESRILTWLSRHIPVTQELKGTRFLDRAAGQWRATPLLVALISIELSDITFAIDSVPAALAISQNRFVVYSSNAFAILGLRALYLVVEHALSTLPYLHYGLAAVLAFAGLKMLTSSWLHLPPLVSVGIIATCIAMPVAMGIVRRRR